MQSIAVYGVDRLSELAIVIPLRSQTVSLRFTYPIIAAVFFFGSVRRSLTAISIPSIPFWEIWYRL